MAHTKLEKYQNLIHRWIKTVPWTETPQGDSGPWEHLGNLLFTQAIKNQCHPNTNGVTEPCGTESTGQHSLDRSKVDKVIIGHS